MLNPIKHLKSILLIWLVLELLAFYGVAKLIGVLYAILLLLLLMFIGIFQFRRTGIARFKNMQEQLQKGQAIKPGKLPSISALISGILLVIPGFITAIIGLVLLIPRTNQWLLSWLMMKAMAGVATKTHTKKPDAGRVIDADDNTNGHEDDHYTHRD